jgi:Pyruvate/2-oxoacid:ferredoxin oxidoreductase delta subunit
MPAAHTLRQCGFAAAAQELGIGQADFDHGQAVSHGTGLLCKQLMIARGALSADGIISLAKLKTHGLTILTGAIKNQYGCVPGLTKAEYHARFPDVFDFSRLLADITAFLRPRLYVVDAVWAMEGNGPQGGDPKKLGCLLFSRDPVALEVACCRLVNVDPGIVPTVAAGKAAGLGTDSMADIDLAGDDLDALADRTFRARRTPPLPMPRSPVLVWLRSFFSLRPHIIKKNCTRCGTCIKACPLDPKAVDWKKGAAGTTSAPRYDYRRCIRCFCCQEMCPSKAITVRAPLARRLFPIAAYLGLIASHVNNRIRAARKS